MWFESCGKILTGLTDSAKLMLKISGFIYLLFSGGPRDGVVGVVRSPDGGSPRSSSGQLAGYDLDLAHHHHLLPLRLLRQSGRAQVTSIHLGKVQEF